MSTSKRHILYFCGYTFAFESVSAATSAAALLAKMVRVRHITSGDYDDWHYTPCENEDMDSRIQLEMGQRFKAPAKPQKPKALPAPKRGSIQCICEKSYVAPRQSCPHCGRPFSESHNRTHGSKPADFNLE